MNISLYEYWWFTQFPLSIGIATCVKCKIQVRRKIIILSVKCRLYKKSTSLISLSQRGVKLVWFSRWTKRVPGGHGYQTRTAEDGGTSLWKGNTKETYKNDQLLVWRATSPVNLKFWSSSKKSGGMRPSHRAFLQYLYRYLSWTVQTVIYFTPKGICYVWKRWIWWNDMNMSTLVSQDLCLSFWHKSLP